MIRIDRHKGTSMASKPISCRYSTTEEFARSINVETRTVLKRVSKTGHYFGVRPIKGPNRFLYWPDDAHDQFFLNGGEPLSAEPPKATPIDPTRGRTEQQPERGTRTKRSPSKTKAVETA
ncbi:hypothetical protein [Paraburkholderia sediminicola]|uniref:hypothetical protein n=1 Tax=Paraburkholderia sediminicola TaxID=458836 RepID=UPI0038BB1151